MDKTIISDNFIESDFVSIKNKKVVRNMILTKKLTTNQYALYKMLCDLEVEHKTLKVLIDGEIPTQERLSQYISMSPRIISKHLRVLEEVGLIYRKKIYTTYAIYLNPLFCSTSTQLLEINEETLSYFNLTPETDSEKYCEENFIKKQ